MRFCPMNKVPLDALHSLCIQEFPSPDPVPSAAVCLINIDLFRPACHSPTLCPPGALWPPGLCSSRPRRAAIISDRCHQPRVSAVVPTAPAHLPFQATGPCPPPASPHPQPLVPTLGVSAPRDLSVKPGHLCLEPHPCRAQLPRPDVPVSYALVWFMANQAWAWLLLWMQVLTESA